MRKLLYILLFIPILNNAQYNTVVDLDKDTVESGSGNVVLDFGKVYQSGAVLVTDLSSLNENSIDSLTFNSTADTITKINSDTVWMDNVDNYVIGNCGRFGSAVSGTVYTVLEIYNDTAFILDQSFTGNVGDEFFVACIGTIQDITGNGKHLSQTTGAYQPQMLWFNTDSCRMRYDGIDDLYDMVQNNIDTAHTVMFVIEEYARPDVNVAISRAGSGNYLSPITNDIFNHRLNATNHNLASVGIFPVNNVYYIAITRNATELKLYINGSFIDDATIAGANNVDMILDYIGARGGSSLYFDGVIDDIKIYDGVVNTSVITNYYNNGRF